MTVLNRERETLIEKAKEWLKNSGYTELPSPEVDGYFPALYGERSEEGVNGQGYTAAWTSKCMIEISAL